MHVYLIWPFNIPDLGSLKSVGGESVEYLENDSLCLNNDLDHQHNARDLWGVFKNITQNLASFPEINKPVMFQVWYFLKCLWRGWRSLAHKNRRRPWTRTPVTQLVQGPQPRTGPETGAMCRASRPSLLGAGASGANVEPDCSADFCPPSLGLQRLSLLTWLLAPSSPHGHRPHHFLAFSACSWLCAASIIHCGSGPSLTVVTNRGQVILSAPRWYPIYLMWAGFTQTKAFSPQPQQPQSSARLCVCFWKCKSEKEIKFLPNP